MDYLSIFLSLLVCYAHVLSCICWPFLYLCELLKYRNVGRGMARMSASRNTVSKPPNSQTKEL